MNMESEPTVGATPSKGTCLIKSIMRNQSIKYGQPIFSGPELFCPDACTGLQHEPRHIGNVVLPHIFDRVFCPDIEGSIADPGA